MKRPLSPTHNRRKFHTLLKDYDTWHEFYLWRGSYEPDEAKEATENYKFARAQLLKFIRKTLG